MKNFKNDSFMIQTIYVLSGIAIGIICFYIYTKVPTQKTALMIAVGVFAALTLLYGVKRNCKMQYETALNKVSEAVLKGRNGNIAFNSPENEIPSVKEIYNQIEAMRQTLRKKEILQTAAMDINNSMALNLEFYKLINVLMGRLVEEMDANRGVFYIYHEHTERLELKKALGLSKKVYQEFDVLLGEGLIGIAAQSGNIEIYSDIPKSVIFENRTFLGDITPKNIMAVPVKCQDKLVAVMGFGTIYDFTPEQLHLMKLLQYPMGFAIANSLAYEKTQDLTKELKLQNQLIQNMNAEMSKRMAMCEEESIDQGI